jgi:Txe/YoeB family toxin of Txe-Axe toxin-antitoxin module
LDKHEENCGARTKESWSAKIEVDARTKFDVVPATVEITRMEDHYE